jgi:hypothetical protein
MKQSLSYGINIYPDPRNNLHGCVNDAKGWSDILINSYDYHNHLLLDDMATTWNILERFGNMISNSKSGDSLVLTGSSHGTSIPTKDGNEIDGTEEAICTYNGIILDNTLRDMIKKLPDGVNLTVILDSCFSGTCTRTFLDSNIVPRYCEFYNKSVHFTHSLISSLIIKEEDMKEILISGCSDSEYSYDATINGVAQGAMSYYAQSIIRKQPFITYNQLDKELKKYLPSRNYKQKPQIEGKQVNKDKIIFA